MVTSPDTQQINHDLERQTRNVFQIGLLITIVSTVVVIGTGLMQYWSGENYYMWITAVGIFGGILAMLLARRNQVVAASITLIASLFLVALIYVILFEGVATNLTIIMAILSFGIAIQTIPPKKLRIAVVLIVAATVGLIILDQFWPEARNTPPPQTANIIALTGVITILILVITVFRQFSSFSIRGKLIGATLAVAFLSVAAVAFGVNIFTTRTVTTEVGNNLNSLVTSQSLVIGEFLSTKLKMLQTLSTNQIIIDNVQEKNASYVDSDVPLDEQIALASDQWLRTTVNDEIVKNVLEGDVAVELNKYQDLFPDNVQLIVTDKNGVQVGATRRTRQYYNGDESWWQYTYANGFGSAYIGDPVYDSATDNFTIVTAVPILGQSEDGGKEVVGVIQAIVSLDPLSTLLFNSRFGETGSIEIFLDGDRHLTVNEQKDIKVENSSLNPDAIAYMKNPDAPFTITEFNDASHFLSSTYITTISNEPAVEYLKWIILATQHSDEILAPVDQQQRINTLLGIIVVVFAGAVAAFVGQRISQPITNLTEVAEAVTAGNLDVQAPIETQDEIGILAMSFNGMTMQLRESISLLEQRVADRTQAIATSAEVGRQISTILDEDELITAVVNQVRDAFNYYQAQIYLLADDGKTLVMAGGTGEAGQQMIADGHSLMIGKGIVGRAAETNQVILVSDVTQDDNWLPNPLLPDTKSETAVPIAIGKRVIGVLDVQDNTINGLQIEDTELLQSVANQVAVALRNARLYKETQKRARQETLLRSINQKISGTTDVETAMKVAIRELGQALGTPQTFIRLGHPDTPLESHPANGDNNPEKN